MNAAAISSLYTAYKRFTVSRAKYWKPKIHADLKQMIRNATSVPSGRATDERDIPTAIKQLDVNMLKPSGLAITLQNIYKDAGRVWGGQIYQVVKKEAGKATRQNQRQQGGMVKGNLIAHVDNSKEAIIPLDKLPEWMQAKRLMPIGFNEEMINVIISYLRLHDLQMVQEISDTMKGWILDRLIEGQREGQSLQQIADNMLKHDFPANRAIVISRTETIKAANFGAVQGAKKTGLLAEKEWISARGIRTRRIPRDEYDHLHMHGKTVAMDEAFKVPNRNGSFDSLMQPGDPSGDAADVIQCRCTVGFNVVRDARGLPIRV